MILKNFNRTIKLINALYPLTNTSLFIFVQLHAKRAGALSFGQCEETKMAAVVVVMTTRIMAI